MWPELWFAGRPRLESRKGQSHVSTELSRQSCLHSTHSYNVEWTHSNGLNAINSAVVNLPHILTAPAPSNQQLDRVSQVIAHSFQKLVCRFPIKYPLISAQGQLHACPGHRVPILH